MKYLAYISYNGTRFYGFQKLNDYPTIQRELERVLKIINKTKVEVKGAGRTDRGVHATNQAISFSLDVDIPIIGLKKAMNSLLDKDIYVKSIKAVESDFHPRFNCVNKKYKYIINMGEYNPLVNDLEYNYNRKLNIKEMKKASKYLIGNHDFKAFTSGYRDNYDSGIYKITFKEIDNTLEITFHGKSFYRYMVRNLVGALIMVGEDKARPMQIKDMLDNKNKEINYITVPACGLYLIEVNY